jgi:RES domain-containing protein
MGSSGRVHDRAILDAVEAADVISFSQTVWRIVRAGRDPILGSTADGRGSPGGTVEVLYTSIEREGALAEIGFRLSLEPVWPSRIAHEMHEIGFQAERTLNLADMASLGPFGIDVSRYASFDYTATQAAAAAAHFLEFDGLIVPSARHQSQNLVIFMDRDAAGTLYVRASEAVDWNAWRAVGGKG